MKNTIINQVIILGLIMLVGVVARKKEMLNAEVNMKLSDFLLNVTLPCLILSSFTYEYSPEMLKNTLLILMYSVIVNLVLIFISKIFVFKFDESSKKVIRYIIIFSNCAFMGFPILEGLFGKIGVFYGAIFNIPWNIFTLSFGYMLFSGENDLKTLKSVAVHPGIIATVIGFLLFAFSLKLPVPIAKALNSVGAMTTPLSMIIVGSLLAEIKFKDIFSGFSVYYASAMRLFVIPVITFAIMKLLHANELHTQILVTLEAMPAPVMATVMANKFDADTSLASRCVFISTVLSMFTIPIIMTTLF